MREISDLEQELEREYQLDVEGTPLAGGDLETDFEAYGEDVEEGETEGPSEGPGGDYAERMHELSMGGPRPEQDLTHEVEDVLQGMERDYFLGGLLKKARKLGKSGLLRKLVKKGLRYASRKIPALQAIKGVTQLARGNLTGALKQMAMAGLSSAVPGASVALPALQNLGLAGEVTEEGRAGWERFVELSREAYEALADRVTEDVDDPVVASAVAHEAFQTAFQRAVNGVSRPLTGSARGPRRIRLTKGEVVIIEGA